MAAYTSGSCCWRMFIETSGDCGACRQTPIVKAEVQFVNWEENESSMRVIPVIDLMNGWVVRGVAGERSQYRPIQSQIAADARPGTVARAFVEQFAFDAVYVADLDAILFPADQKETLVPCYGQIMENGLSIWLDAGIGHAKTARYLSETLCRLQIRPEWVVGLESLSSPQALSEIGDILGSSHMIASLDLKSGVPLTSIAPWQSFAPIEIARLLLATGISRLIVLDLADVGTGGGTRTLELCRQIRREFPDIQLIGGGGVRGLDDVKALASAGCNGTLVASALHDGRLTPEDIRQMENLTR